MAKEMQTIDWKSIADVHHRRACIVGTDKKKNWQAKDLARREKDLRYAFLGYYFVGSKALYEVAYLLTLVAIEQGQYKKAERFAKFAYSRIFNEYGDIHTYSTKFLGVLAYISFQSCDLNLAEQRLKEYLSIYADVYCGEDYNDMLKLYFSTQIKLGRSLYKLKRYKAAVYRFQNAHVLLPFVYKKDDVQFHRLQFFIKQSVSVLQMLKQGK